MTIRDSARPAPGKLAAVGAYLLKNTTVLYLAALLLAALLFVPNFATAYNLSNILRQSAVPIISCVTMSFILVTGNVDLSIGYMVGLSSITCGIMLQVYNTGSTIAILAALGIGLLFGLLNGLLIAICNIPSFIATLGSGLVLYGLAQALGGNKSITGLPASFRQLGNFSIGGFPVMVYYALIVVAAAYLVIHKSAFGRELRSIGYNTSTSKLSGIKVRRDLMLIFIISGVMASLCSVLLTMRIDSAQPDLGGSSFPFEAITAAVVGGTSMLGGRVNILCCALGAIIVKIIENCINLLNINYYMYQSVLGIMILIALITEAIKAKSE